MPALPDEASFYSRQVVVPEIGQAGQDRLKMAKVLVIGAGGLGSPLLLYLTGAGIGTIGIADFDFVEVSNLHRQIVHSLDRVDMPKTESAILTLCGINPYVRFVRHDIPVSAQNADALVTGYDIVADGSDNFVTRDAVHAACRRAGITLVSAALQLTNGILTTFKSHLGPPHPCFRCLYPVAPEAGITPSCSQIGVLGPAVGAMGTMQAVEVIKEILGIEPSLSGTFAMYDAWSCEIEKVEFARRPDCPACGSHQPPVTGGKKAMSSVEARR
jgi:molybdopterin/thiamine biosynthesis adenylyltransferase